MEMIKRVLAEKRLAVTLVVVGLGIDVGLYGLAVYPWSLKVANAETRAAAAAVDREAAMQAFEYARQTLDGKTQATTSYASSISRSCRVISLAPAALRSLVWRNWLPRTAS